MRDERELRAIASELSDAIRRAAWGQSAWEDVCKVVTRSYPGSYAALLNQNVRTPGFGFFVSDGIEEEDFHSFLNYYSRQNPWEDFWTKSPSGSIIVSERDDPASLYYDSEFYNDWMKKVGDYDAAVGLRIHSGLEELVYFPIHYSPRFSETYDRELEYVMKTVRPVFDEAISIKQRIRSLGEYQTALAALIDREDAIAFVIDDAMRLKNANAAAVAEFEHGKMLRCQHNRVRFQDSAFNERFLQACKMLADGAAQSRRKLALRGKAGGGGGGGLYHFSLSPARYRHRRLADCASANPRPDNGSAPNGLAAAYRASLGDVRPDAARGVALPGVRRRPVASAGMRGRADQL